MNKIVLPRKTSFSKVHNFFFLIIKGTDEGRVKNLLLICAFVIVGTSKKAGEEIEFIYKRSEKCRS
jgi:hypothetical protein